MSSPRMNNLITVGCILCYFSVICFGLDGNVINDKHAYDVICKVGIFKFHAFSVLVFGTGFIDGYDKISFHFTRLVKKHSCLTVTS